MSDEGQRPQGDESGMSAGKVVNNLSARDKISQVKVIVQDEKEP